ncbi:hypothetical protein XdyCFBP7245_02665 [Xanthomonas dyei]|uniref:Uncharacterized protein n=1 Tax=Xanthomonas dyei TaxID=743699 RepID=A0A2S7CAB0_9XANT|nr:hypothetical protein XdyCFBP7245_02665 [Xanthomonas dyei]
MKWWTVSPAVVRNADRLHQGIAPLQCKEMPADPHYLSKLLVLTGQKPRLPVVEHGGLIAAYKSS